MLVDVLLMGELADGSILKKLDDMGRPKLIFGSTIHDNCPRRGHFENGEFVVFGSATQAADEAAGFCLYQMGCKGPTTQTNCPLVRWNHRASWCVEAGSPCIGCGNANPITGGPGNWFDADAPFLTRHADVRLPGIGGVQPSTIGAVVGGVAAVGLVAHGLGSAAKGRVKGVPTETQKVHDAKMASKGGDK
jgi:hydrogenase small subunit